MGNLSNPTDGIGHTVRNNSGGDDASFITQCLSNSLNQQGKVFNATGVDFSGQSSAGLAGRCSLERRTKLLLVLHDHDSAELDLLPQ